MRDSGPSRYSKGMNETFLNAIDDQQAEQEMARFDANHPGRVRFLKIEPGSMYDYEVGTWVVQKCDGMVLGRGLTKVEAWNDFAHIQRIIRK